MTTVQLSQREIAQRLLALRVVMDRIKAEDRRLRDLATEDMRPGDRVTGYLEDADDPLGFVLLAKGRESAVVTDSEAFLEWVRAVAPTEIVTTEKVRESFVTAVLTDVKSQGGWISPEGELLPPEGVEVRTSSPVLSVKPTAEADALIADALAGGRMQLMPGGTDE